jgi:ribosomal protein S18 acetylase RimI-like enzyme
MALRPIAPVDRAPLAALLDRIANFTPAEKQVALELIDDALARPHGDYECLVAGDEREPSRCLGYICFGRTPLTAHTYDLYWVVVDPSLHGRGVGGELLHGMEEKMRERGGKLIRVETSSQETYGTTQRFYDKHGFRLGGRIPRFYRDDDDLLLYYKDID